MTAQPQPLWVPPPDRQRESLLHDFLGRHGWSGYDQAWSWSVDPATAGGFWQSVAEDFGVAWRREPVAPVEADPGRVTGVRWFPGSLVNYAEHCLTHPGVPEGSTAVIGRSQTRPNRDLSWTDLRRLVARIRAGLERAGVAEGDCVAGYLPNVPEAVATMLAAASLGALWTCCSPEMGVASTVDRLSQARPQVLVAVDGYRYGAKTVDRSGEVEEILALLPSVETPVWLGYLHPDRPAPVGWVTWEDLTAREEPLAFAPLPFDHPLYVLFSSGTTGRPKAIVHGHGGILVEHLKALGLHFDLRSGDRFFWYSTTGWMMWNFLASGLLLGTTITCFDGDPSGPDGDGLWALMASTGTTCGGVGAGYLVAGAKAGLTPGARHDLGRLRTLGATGSPLPAAAARWVYRNVGDDLMLASFSGGTDVCTGFVGTSPLHPVWAGEISCRCLGAAVQVFDPDGHPLVGSEGELVVTSPLPSMPVAILGDPDGSRYRSTYFDRYPGVWAHGDRAVLSERGTVVITGRSDGTLNRGGVRMGTAELYAVVEELAGVADSLAVHLEDASGGPGELVLFVVAAPGADPEATSAAIRHALRRDLSPRHLPDHIRYIAAIPRTLSGKKLEVPVKRILSGEDPSRVVNLSALADPDCLRPFLEMARYRSAGQDSMPR